jgi:hypothetical protein
MCFDLCGLTASNPPCPRAGTVRQQLRIIRGVQVDIMKTAIVVCSAAIMLFAIACSASADILAGPIKNPANGHQYYLLSPNSWTASEAEAENLGGTLAIIRDADEQKWVFSTFGTNGGANNHLWIGLYRQYPGGPFSWVNGAKVDYTY